jgi:hypothetical protein
LITDSDGIAKTLLEELFPKDSISIDTELHKQIRQYSSNTDSTEDDIPFSVLEVNEVIESQNPAKALGADGITADIVKHIQSTDGQLLTNIYNKCFELQSFPDKWKKKYH